MAASGLPGIVLASLTSAFVESIVARCGSLSCFVRMWLVESIVATGIRMVVESCAGVIRIELKKKQKMRCSSARWRLMVAHNDG